MALAALLVMSAPMSIPSSPLSIWFDKEAITFTSSCPVGNGRLGGMMFGGVDKERIVLNENTL